MKSKKNAVVFEQEKHIFYNVLSLKFREMTKYDLKFLGIRVLGLNLQETHKNKFIPLLIGEIYKKFVNRHRENDLFWRIADFLSHFMTVSLFHPEQFPIFARLSVGEMVIRHNQKRPDFTRLSRLHLKKSECILKPSGICCLCTDNEPIRKVHKCYVCGIKAHKACFFWNDKTKNKRAQERQEEMDKSRGSPDKDIIQLGDLLENENQSKPAEPLSSEIQKSGPQFPEKSENQNAPKNTQTVSEQEDSIIELESSFERPKQSDGLETKIIFEPSRDSLTFNTMISQPHHSVGISLSPNQNPRIADYRNVNYYSSKKPKSTKLITQDDSEFLNSVSLNKQARNYPLDSREVDFVCPYCILEQYDPFFEPEEVLMVPRLIKNGEHIPFYVDPSICIGDRFVVVKSIQVSPQYNASQGENYNTYDMYFPKRGTLRINGVQVRNFKPEKNGYARRKDFPIVCTLSKNYFPLFSEIPAENLMLLENVLLEYSQFLRKSGSSDASSKRTLFEQIQKLLPPRPSEAWHIKFEMLIRHILPKLNSENLEVLEKSSFQRNLFPEGLFSMLQMNSQGNENVDSHVSLIKGYRGCLRLGLNDFQMEFDPDYEESPNNCYIMAIYLCKHRTASRHIEEILGRQAKEGRMLTNYLNNMRYIRNAFKLFDDSFRINISLRDPLTMTRIRVPVRGDQCCHVNVFCLESFLKNLQNSENRRSKCPFCGKVIVKFIVDFLMLKAIDENRFLSLKQELEDEIVFLRNDDYEIEYFFQKEIPEQDSSQEVSPQKQPGLHAEAAFKSEHKFESSSTLNSTKETFNTFSDKIQIEDTENFAKCKLEDKGVLETFNWPTPSSPFGPKHSEPEFSDQRNQRLIRSTGYLGSLDIQRESLLLFVWNLKWLHRRYSAQKICLTSKKKAFNLNMILQNSNFGCIDIRSLANLNLGFETEVFHEPKRIMTIPDPPKLVVKVVDFPKSFRVPVQPFHALDFVHNSSQLSDLRFHDLRVFPFQIEFLSKNEVISSHDQMDLITFVKLKIHQMRFESMKHSLPSHPLNDSGKPSELDSVLKRISDKQLYQCLSIHPFNLRSSIVGTFMHVVGSGGTWRNAGPSGKYGLAVSNCVQIQNTLWQRNLPLKDVFRMKCKRRTIRIMRFPYLSNKKQPGEKSVLTSFENSKKKVEGSFQQSNEKPPLVRKTPIPKLEDTVPGLLRTDLTKKQKPRKYFIIRRSIKKKSKPKLKKQRQSRYMSPESSLSNHRGHSEDESSAYSLKNFERGHTLPQMAEEPGDSYMGRRTRGRRNQKEKWKASFGAQNLEENEFIPRSEFPTFDQGASNGSSFAHNQRKDAGGPFGNGLFPEDDSELRDSMLFEQHYGRRDFGGSEIEEVSFGRGRLGSRGETRGPNGKKKRKQRISKNYHSSMGKGYGGDLIDDGLALSKSSLNKKKRRKRFRLYEIAKMEMERMYGSIRKGLGAEPADLSKATRAYSSISSETSSAVYKNPLPKPSAIPPLQGAQTSFEKPAPKPLPTPNSMGININGNNIDFNDLGFEPGQNVQSTEGHPNGVYLQWASHSMSQDLTKEVSACTELNQSSNITDSILKPSEDPRGTFPEKPGRVDLGEAARTQNSQEGFTESGQFRPNVGPSGSSSKKVMGANMSYAGLMQKGYSPVAGMRLQGIKRAMRRFKKMPQRKDVTFNCLDLKKFMCEMGFKLENIDRFLKRNQVYFAMIEGMQKENAVNRRGQAYSSEEMQVVDLLTRLCKDDQLSPQEIVEAYHENVNLHKDLFKRAFVTKHESKKKLFRNESINETEGEAKEGLEPEEKSPDEVSVKTGKLTESDEAQKDEKAGEDGKKKPRKTWKNFSDFAKRFRTALNLEVDESGSKFFKGKQLKWGQADDRQRLYSKVMMTKLMQNINDLNIDYGYVRRGKKTTRKKFKFLGDYTFLYDDIHCNLERFRYAIEYYSEDIFKLYLRKAVGAPFFTRHQVRGQNYFMSDHSNPMRPLVNLGSEVNFGSSNRPTTQEGAKKVLNGGIIERAKKLIKEVEKSAKKRSLSNSGVKSKSKQKKGEKEAIDEDLEILKNWEENAKNFRIEVKDHEILLINVKEKKRKETDFLGKREEAIFEEEMSETLMNDVFDFDILKMEDDFDFEGFEKLELKRIKEATGDNKNPVEIVKQVAPEANSGNIDIRDQKESFEEPKANEKKQDAPDRNELLEKKDTGKNEQKERKEEKVTKKKMQDKCESKESEKKSKNEEKVKKVRRKILLEKDNETPNEQKVSNVSKKLLSPKLNDYQTSEIKKTEEHNIAKKPKEQKNQQTQMEKPKTKENATKEESEQKKKAKTVSRTRSDIRTKKRISKLNNRPKVVRSRFKLTSPLKMNPLMSRSLKLSKMAQKEPEKTILEKEKPKLPEKLKLRTFPTAEPLKPKTTELGLSRIEEESESRSEKESQILSARDPKSEKPETEKGVNSESLPSEKAVGDSMIVSKEGKAIRSSLTSPLLEDQERPKEEKEVQISTVKEKNKEKKGEKKAKEANKKKKKKPETIRRRNVSQRLLNRQMMKEEKKRKMEEEEREKRKMDRAGSRKREKSNAKKKSGQNKKKLGKSRARKGDPASKSEKSRDSRRSRKSTRRKKPPKSKKEQKKDKTEPKKSQEKTQTFEKEDEPNYALAIPPLKKMVSNNGEVIELSASKKISNDNSEPAPVESTKKTKEVPLKITSQKSLASKGKKSQAKLEMAKDSKRKESQRAKKNPTDKKKNIKKKVKNESRAEKRRKKKNRKKGSKVEPKNKNKE